MKTKLILKSLADLPANTVSLAASMPGRAMEMTKRVLAPPARANAPLKMKHFWEHGGLNE